MQSDNRGAIIGIIILGLIAVVAIVFTSILLVSNKIAFLDKTKSPSLEQTKSIVLDKTNISEEIFVGRDVTVMLTATTKNITEELVWVSSNDDVAMVMPEGNTATVTLKSAGNATITVTDGNVKATCDIEVTHLATSLTLNKTNVTKTIIAGKKQTFKNELTATLTNAVGVINWESSNTEVATVTQTGATVSITALKAGKTILTASCKVDGTTYFSKCTVIIEETGSEINLVSSKNQVLGIGDNAIIQIETKDISDLSKISWEIEKGKSVSIVKQEDKKLTLVATEPATATITISYGGKTASSTIRWMNPKINSVSTTNGSTINSKEENETLKINLKADISYLGKQSVNWFVECSDGGEAKIIQNASNKTMATLTVTKGGTFTVYARTGNDSKSVQIVVNDIISELKQLSSNHTHYVGESGVITFFVKNSPKDNGNFEIVTGKDILINSDRKYYAADGGMKYEFHYTIVDDGKATVKFTIGSQTKTVTLTGKLPNVSITVEGASGAIGLHDKKTLSLSAQVTGGKDLIYQWRVAQRIDNNPYSDITTSIYGIKIEDSSSKNTTVTVEGPGTYIIEFDVYCQSIFFPLVTTIEKTITIDSKIGFN